MISLAPRHPRLLPIILFSTLLFYLLFRSMYWLLNIRWIDRMLGYIRTFLCHVEHYRTRLCINKFCTSRRHNSNIREQGCKSTFRVPRSFVYEINFMLCKVVNLVGVGEQNYKSTFSMFSQCLSWNWRVSKYSRLCKFWKKNRNLKIRPQLYCILP